MKRFTLEFHSEQLYSCKITGPRCVVQMPSYASDNVIRRKVRMTSIISFTAIRMKHSKEQDRFSCLKKSSESMMPLSYTSFMVRRVLVGYSFVPMQNENIYQ